jgi:serine/threonine protein kinase
MSLPNSSKRKVFDGRYEILSIVGRGADSVVYHARHISAPNQEVAIKVLVNRDGSSKLTDKLRKEALTLVSCRHKYVVRLDDFHSIKDLCYLSMEFAAQGDLVKYLKTTNGKLSADQTTRFLKQSLEALDFIHATGVVHRDLKPENILVMNEKEIRLADFGLALLPGDAMAIEELRNAVGTFDYLAPEVLDGVQCDAVSDIYSLGISFYESVTGQHPFANIPLARQREAREDRNVKPLKQLAPELPDHICAAIHQMIRFNPEHRFQSAMDALHAIANEDFRGFKGLSEDEYNAPSAAIVETPAEQTVAKTPLEIALSGQTALKVEQPSSSDQSTPANSDAIDPRPAQPTETIDLERIKSIIARESQRKPASSSGATATDNETSAKSTKRAEQRNKPKRATPHPLLMVLGGLWGAFYSLPSFIRPIAVAGLSAVLTIGSLMAWNTLFDSGKRSERGALASTTSTSQIDSSQEPDSHQAEDGQTALSLRKLPEGIYTGSVSGLIPGATVPLAIISQPQEDKMILMLGVEGWLPATATLSTDGETETSPITFRSNGIILRFDQELASREITGNIVDVVTGETGRWKLIGNS